MISINITKAKDIAHTHRRLARETEFTQPDKIIALRLPGMSLEEAEAERQAIRERYATIQAAIEAAASTEELKLITDQCQSIIAAGHGV